MIHKAIILGLTIWVAVLLFQLHTCKQSEQYKPLFQVKTCFQFKNHARLDGMVMYKEDDSYVIMWTEEAERRYPGPKVGHKIGVKYLDMYASRVKCPVEWVNHTAGRKK